MTSIFVLTTADSGLVREQDPDESSVDILWSGQVFRSLAAAQASAQANVDDKREGDTRPLDWAEMVRDKIGEPEEGEARCVGYTHAWCEDLELTVAIREFRLDD